jgi:catechol 2,3-dioxygenase-like lactoylglutathione lyase family enzyme
MILGPIEAVRVFTTKLADARRFYADTLGLPEMSATDAMAMFDTGQAKLIVEHVDSDDPEAAGLVGRASPRSPSQS